MNTVSKVTNLTNLTLPQKVLLLFIRSGEKNKIDPIRIMKGLFLISQETLIEWLPADARYSFVPYDYGPCSFDVYDDLRFLESHGLIDALEKPFNSWKYYSISPEGEKKAKEILKQFDERFLSYLIEVRQFIDSLQFRQLLEVIYSNYPAFAENTIFKF